MADQSLEAARVLFIRRWGEMGAAWGISRTMAEIHALLYVSTEPLCTDDIMDRLAVSRGSVSMNLRELANWELIQRVHRRGDRKDYYEAEHDVWLMFETIVRERRRREVLPIIETLERCLLLVEQAEHSNGSADEEQITQRRRYNEILEFCELMNGLFSVVSKAGQRGVKPLVKFIGKFVTPSRSSSHR